MGLLTKIFGNTDGGGETVVERPEGHRDSGVRSADGEERVQPGDADSGSSGIRPAVEPVPPALQDSTRAPGTSRRPEHPRMYLRPTPMLIDPSVPGSTRRPQIALRPTGKESGTGRGLRPQTVARPASEPPPQSSSSAAEPTPAEVRSTRTPPSGNHPKPAMVVSPVSLTAEELQLPEGARPKMETLLGLGMGVGVKVPAGAVAQPAEEPERPAPKSAQLAEEPEQPSPSPVAASANERRIVRELLAALDGLLPIPRQRLEREMGLEELARATPEVLAQELEAPIERARALSELVASYLRERRSRATTDTLQTLSTALEELAQRSRELDEHDDNQDAEQRQARVRRRAALTHLNLLLAERGELDLLDALEPCATAERLSRLREWLSSDAALWKPSPSGDMRQS